jgi:uridylate kinase
MSAPTVISLGGSIVMPGDIDVDYVARLVATLRGTLNREPARRFALVVGGGAAARAYQRAARTLAPGIDHDRLDEIGIAATRINAEMVRAAFGELCPDPIFTDPTAVSFTGHVLVGGGWKPGFSTDNVAVRLAETLGADTVINLSNIRQIYTADPNTDPEARPLDTITWDELIAIVGSEWKPGKNTPFDPVATARAARLEMTVIAADGRDLPNFEALLEGRPFVGTTISATRARTRGRPGRSA